MGKKAVFFITLIVAFYYSTCSFHYLYGSENNPEIIINSIGMKLKLIKAGEFFMGSEKGAIDEKPVHKVMISKDFYIGIYEVTQAQYKRVMGKNPSMFKGDNLPLENVSYEDAREFCRRLSEKEGKIYRLPTEAEWEYVCRAGTTTEHFWGDEFDHKLVYCADNTKRKTQQAGSKKPNPWGIYDMAGNVWEWCSDWYNKRTYTKGERIDPKGPDNGEYRVIRGGSYDLCGLCYRSAYRGSRTPDTRTSTIGFRVVMELLK